MDKQYAIFDMDGTLVDSMVFWKNLALEYLHSKGVAHIPEDIPERIKPMTMSESAALYAARTAKNAGYYVVGVYDDSAKADWQTLSALADEAIESWEDII